MLTEIGGWLLLCSVSAGLVQKGSYFYRGPYLQQVMQWALALIMEEVILGNGCSWGPIFHIRTVVCLFCREDYGAKDENMLWEQIKYLTNSVPFGKGMIWYTYELKKENFPYLKKEKKYFPSKYNNELILPQRRIFHVCNYIQISSWIFSISSSYALPQTLIHSLCCHIQQIQQNHMPVKHVLLCLFPPVIFQTSGLVWKGVLSSFRH